MALTFKGGVHLNEHKNTAGTPIRVLPAPPVVTIPMSQHIGAHCTPVVAVGDVVDKGQVIGVIEKGLGCPVHASVSGKVTAITTINDRFGLPLKCVVIENDYEERISPSVRPFAKDIMEATPEELIQVIRDAGITGMGGAAFPTYQKIVSANGKATKVAVNCAECEPYITVNHRLLLENPASVIGGLKIVMKALGIREGTIAIEDNKMDAVRKIEQVDYDPKMISITLLKTKYPQGDERQILYALTGKELGRGKLPDSLGYVVLNTETCAAIFNAFTNGMPVVSRIVTVDGDCVENPGNYYVPLGTPASYLLDHCGRKEGKKMKKLIFGGPMMGVAQWDEESPVIKGTSAVLAFSYEYERKKPEDAACIHCGKCVAACPMHLMPNNLYAFSRKGDLDSCDEYDVQSCIECGTCSYSCPAELPLVQGISSAKARSIARSKAAAAAAATKKEAEKK